VVVFVALACMSSAGAFRAWSGAVGWEVQGVESGAGVGVGDCFQRRWRHGLGQAKVRRCMVCYIR
jgi:hypothetical protein